MFIAANNSPYATRQLASWESVQPKAGPKSTSSSRPAILFSEEEAPTPAKKIEDRRTPELIIGLVGPIGSGATKTALILEEILAKDYNYKVTFHKVRELIGACAQHVGMVYDESRLSGESRVDVLQKIGNELRKKFSADYLARKCIEQIALDRLRDGYLKDGMGNLVPLPQRRVHLIDSLKHPAELELLRLVYGDIFWLVGVFAPEDIRKDRLLGRGVDKRNLDALIMRDENEDLAYGQKVRETFYNADFFIRNDQVNEVELRRVIVRYLDILLNVDVRTPNRHEAAMYSATSAAATSACLSRQVGAAIYSNEGELLGVGWNDVPRAGGGLYRDENEKGDHRCYRWGGKICHNDDRKERLFRKIYDALVADKLIDEAANFADVKSSLYQCGIRELLEFSRSIHAEMEAILSVARAGGKGLVGGTLYTTTYPCHNCARHIVAAGIDKVYFIEPFPKSLAVALHSDSISASLSAEKKVVFLQYEGVAPKNIIRLFKVSSERKRDGRLFVRQRTDAVPAFQPMLDGFATYEQKIVEELSVEEGLEPVKEEL